MLRRAGPGFGFRGRGWKASFGRIEGVTLTDMLNSEPMYRAKSRNPVAKKGKGSSAWKLGSIGTSDCGLKRYIHMLVAKLQPIDRRLLQVSGIYVETT